MLEKISLSQMKANFARELQQMIDNEIKNDQREKEQLNKFKTKQRRIMQKDYAAETLLDTSLDISIKDTASISTDFQSSKVDKYLKVRQENSLKQSKIEQIKTKREVEEIQR